MTKEEYQTHKIRWRIIKERIKERRGISKKQEKNRTNFKGMQTAVCMLQKHKALEFANRKRITNHAHPSIQARGTGIE